MYMIEINYTCSLGFLCHSSQILHLCTFRAMRILNAEFISKLFLK